MTAASTRTLKLSTSDTNKLLFTLLMLGLASTRERSA
jgi:hypothetical protein